MTQPPSEGDGGWADGGTHTVSGLGQQVKDPVGWTVVGGAVRGTGRAFSREASEDQGYTGPIRSGGCGGR